jgi:hypothetical protein
MPNSPTDRPERPTWFPEQARPTLDHEWQPTADEFDAYLDALDDYEEKLD